MTEERRKKLTKSKAILLAMLIATLTIVPIFPVRAQTNGPYMDYLHIINYGDTTTEYNAFDIGEIDITDWPATAYWIDKWVYEGRVPSEITLSWYAGLDAFEYDLYNQKWPTGCDGVADREGFTGTYTRGAYTWNNYHIRQRPDKGDYLSDHPPTYNPATQTTPMGDGADYDPETTSWKTYFDEDCLWCTCAWGFRLALAYLTDKDYIISTILEGLGAKMRAWACAPAQEGYLDIANLTSSSFVYHGPEGDVTVSSLIFGYGMTRAQMEAKADALLDAAGFKDWDTDGTRNDPRKVAGADKQYGTIDDVTTAASNMDDIILYARIDDPNRIEAGVTLANEMEDHDIPVNLNVAEMEICFSKARIEYDYHIYTGGYFFSADPWDISYSTWHSSQYLYPVGWSGGYQGFCHVEHDAYVDLVKNSDDYGTILAGFRKATFLQNKYVCSIPLWSSTSFKAYRTGWDGVTGEAGRGIDNYWSFFNMRKAAEDTINWGFKTSTSNPSVVTSFSIWDWKVLGLIYESLIVRNPYDLSEDRSMLATSYSTGSWAGGLYVDFNLKSGVKWHDGTSLTAEDVKWGLEFIRDCGPGVAWNYVAIKDLENVTVTSPGPGGSVRCYFNTASYWAVHLAGFLEFPSRKIWMNASEYYGWGYDPTKPPGIGAGLRWPSDSQRMAVRNYHPYDDDIYDPASATPNADGIVDLVQDGTGPWKFVGYTGPIDAVETIDLEAFRDHHLSQSEVTSYLDEAFHLLGNVNYPGSFHESDYIADLIGIDRVIDERDVLLVSHAYLTTPSDPPGINWGEWNVDCDFNKDNIVDDADAAIVSYHYGSSADSPIPRDLHDVAILYVATSQTVIEQGSSVSINVTVENQGHYAETFNVTVSYDSTDLETKKVVDLTPDANTTLIYTWDTTGVPLGDYVISAEADSVPDELYTSDNSYTDGTVYIYTPIVQSSVSVGGTDYPIGVETNVTITDVSANRNILRFKTSGPTGLTGYINTTIPVGLNKTAIKVFLDGAQVTPPPFPIVTTNGTHYFVYVEFTLSTHEMIIQYAVGDIAVTKVTPSKTIVGQGYNVAINVTVENQGSYTETFNVTAYANTTVIDTFTNISLTSGNSTTLAFTWNTTSAAKGNYTISANATKVLGEVDTGDNSYIYGTIRVNMPGDVAPAYGEVDIVDVVYVAIHFGSEQGKPPPPNTQPYEPNADINGDSIIDIVDIVIVAIHFGETDP